MKRVWELLLGMKTKNVILAIIVLQPLIFLIRLVIHQVRAINVLKVSFVQKVLLHQQLVQKDIMNVERDQKNAKSALLVIIATKIQLVLLQ